MTRQRLVLLAGLAMVGLLAWWWSFTPLVSDDLLFMSRALEHRGDPAAIFDRTLWFQHQRPLFYGSFWLLGPLELGGQLLRAWQVLLWAGIGGGLMAWAQRRHGAEGVLLVGLLLVLSPAWLDLLHWRSWLTTTGTTAGLALGLWALHSGRTGLLFAAGLFAAGFKETGPMVLGLAALLFGGASVRTRGVGLVLVLLAVSLGMVVTDKLQLETVPESVRNTLDALRPLSWTAALLWARRRPGAPWWWLGLLALLPLLPGPAAGAVALGVSLWVAGRLALALAVAWGLSTIGQSWHAAYLVEGWVLVTVVWITGPPLVLPRVAWVAAALPALVNLGPQLQRTSHFHERARHQRTFLAAFDPAPAAKLYFPRGPIYELDVLVWQLRGATLAGAPPPGVKPAQTGPLSGVWADVDRGAD